MERGGIGEVERGERERMRERKGKRESWIVRGSKGEGGEKEQQYREDDRDRGVR